LGSLLLLKKMLYQLNQLVGIVDDIDVIENGTRSENLNRMEVGAATLYRIVNYLITKKRKLD